MLPRPAVIAFDIVGTVFSLEPVRAELVKLGLPGLALDLLYATALRDGFACAAAGRFVPFRDVLANGLDEVLVREGLRQDALSGRGREAVLSAMAGLTPHPDAGEAMATLRRAGIRIVALSNGAATATQGLLDRGGLSAHVEAVLSVEDVGLFKPRAEVYRHAAVAMGVAPAAMMLVACHPWDVQGAKAAGLLGAYVARGLPYPAGFLQPDLAGEDLASLAHALAGLRETA